MTKKAFQTWCRANLIMLSYQSDNVADELEEHDKKLAQLVRNVANSTTAFRDHLARKLEKNG